MAGEDDETAEGEDDETAESEEADETAEGEEADETAEREEEAYEYVDPDRLAVGSTSESVESLQDTDLHDSLIVVSNRQPYRHEYDEDSVIGDKSTTDGDTIRNDRSTIDGGSAGRDDSTLDGGSPNPDDRSVSVDEPAGGLTAGLDPVMQQANGTWIAWGDGEADSVAVDETDCVRVPPESPSYTLRRVWLSDDAVEGYYRGFSNQVLWPLCHELADLVSHRSIDLEWYRFVNRKFATTAASHADADSIVWIQDYHFGFAPRMIREIVPSSTTIGQFWHVPWPAAGTFERCPAGAELLDGLLGNDLLAFHLDSYVENFLDCVDRYVPLADVDRSTRSVEYRDRITRVRADPMGIDAAEYDRLARSIDADRWDAFRSRHDIPEGCTIGLGVDRLDYTKGIPQRLDALERFFERNPSRHGEFTFVQKATPSRTEVPAYRRLGERVRNQVESINDRFATEDWTPIVYTEAYLPREDLCALYRRADVMVVSSVKDGMNLVAQEYVASHVDDGALVLSEGAGVHDRLGSAAFTIDPSDSEGFAETIARVLRTPETARRQRMDALRETVFDADIRSWMTTQLKRLESIHLESGRSVDGPNSRRDTIAKANRSHKRSSLQTDTHSLFDTDGR